MLLTFVMLIVQYISSNFKIISIAGRSIIFVEICPAWYFHESPVYKSVLETESS
jgi:succinate-acetate transporter protein